MWPTSTLSSIFYCVILPVASSSLFNSVRCPGNGVIQCGISHPIESHEAVSLGQCTLACEHVAGCHWFHFIVDSIVELSRGLGLCQMFDRPPQVGVRQGCTLFASDMVPSPIKTPPENVGIIVQQNYNGSTFFQRTWNEFKAGFGDVNSNYWIGNDQLHTLTSGDTYRLRVDLQDRDDCQWYWAEYSTFIVGSEATNYRLTIAGFSGTAGDAMIADEDPYMNNNGMMFTTLDANNGGCAWYINCAVTPAVDFDCGGAFWHNCCTPVYINTPSNCASYGFMWLNMKLQYSRLTLI